MNQSGPDMSALNQENNPWTFDVQDVWNPTKEPLEPVMMIRQEFTSIQDFIDSSDMESLAKEPVSPVDPDTSGISDKSGLESQEVSKDINGRFQQPCEEGSIQYSFQDFMDSSDMESLPNGAVSPVDPDKSDFEGQKICKLLNGHLQQPCEVGSTQYCLQDFMDDFHFDGQEVEAAIQNMQSPKEFLSPELTRISQNGPIYLDSDEFQLLEGQEVGACLQNMPYVKDFLAPKFAPNGPKSPVDPDLDEIHVRFEGREVEAALQNIPYPKKFLSPEFPIKMPYGPISPDEFRFRFESQEVETALQNIPNPKDFLSPEFPVDMPEFENYIPLSPKIFETKEVNMCAGKVQFEPNSCFGPKSILQNNQEIQPFLQNDAKFAMKSESLMTPQMGPEQGK